MAFSLDERVFAERAAARVFGCSREELLAHPERLRQLLRSPRFVEMLKRFRAGEPQQYILEEVEFYGMLLKVDARAFIPRPETELLVDEALLHIRERGLRTMLDIGTGSGAIAIAVARNAPDITVTAIDISSDAVAVARKNVAAHNMQSRVSVAEGDLLSPLASGARVDIIVANLPYIGMRAHSYVANSVKDYEPAVALYGGEDGLALYRNLFWEMCEKSLYPHVLIGEIGFSQGKILDDALHTFFVQNRPCAAPRATREIRCDLAGLDRYFVVSFHHA